MIKFSDKEDLIKKANLASEINANNKYICAHAQKNSQDATIEAAKVAQLQDQAAQNEQFFNYKMNYQGYKDNQKLAKIPTFKTQ